MHKKTIIIYSSVLVLLVLYFIEIKIWGFAIPCIFRAITGFKCPGCGVTHLLISLSHLDFKSAFRYNPFIFISSPLILYFVLKDTLFKCGFIKSKISHTENVVLYVYIALFVMFGVLRNIYERLI